MAGALNREGLLEALLSSAVDYAIIALNLDGTILSWNVGAQQIFGWTEQDMVGRSVSHLFVDDDRTAGVPDAEISTALRTGRAKDERWHPKRDGARFWGVGEMMPLRDRAGATRGYVKILRDRTPERAEEERRRAEAEFLRSVLASSNDCIKVLDLEGRVEFMSEASQRIMEVNDFDAIRGFPWPDMWTGDCNAEARKAVDTARAGGAGRLQGRADTMAGNSKWWDVQVTPIFGADGKPNQLLSISLDITELKQAEERQKLLMQELAHRVKNTLAIIMAISSQTFRSSSSLDEARDKLSGRLMALSHAHDILLRGDGMPASLLDVVKDAMSLHAGSSPERVVVDGQDIKLDPAGTLSFSLLLHELGTNAIKYGSLSVPEGQVRISWRLEQTREDQHLTFCWQEVGGPPVAAPKRKGFGSRLIERLLAGGFKASVVVEYRQEGVTLTLDAPLAELQRA